MSEDRENYLDMSVDDEDQLQPEDTLDDGDLDDVLDRGYSPPDRPPRGYDDYPTEAEMRRGESLDERLSEEVPDVDTWDCVTRSRRPDRPGVRRLLRYGASDVVPLNGTGQSERDPGLLIALARFGEAPCIFLGQDRRGQTTDHPMGPEALREARRGMRLASELGLPLVTVIDTQGAALSADAENGGLAGEIARSLADLVTLDAPTLCLMLGEGNGGGALALLPADRVVAAQHAWLSPLPPEGASAIVHRDLDHAADMARAQQVRAIDLYRRGIVDRIVAEKPDAADEAEDFCRRVGAVLEHELSTLLAAGPGSPEQRARRYV